MPVRGLAGDVLWSQPSTPHFVAGIPCYRLQRAVRNVMTFVLTGNGVPLFASHLVQSGPGGTMRKRRCLLFMPIEGWFMARLSSARNAWTWAENRTGSRGYQSAMMTGVPPKVLSKPKAFFEMPT